MAERRRVLFVNNDLHYLIRHFEARLRAVAARYHLEAAAPPDAAGRLAWETCFPGVVLHDIPLKRGGIQLTDLRTIAALCGLFRRVRPDLVHLATLKPVVYGGLALRLVRGPALLANVAGLGIAFAGRDGVATHPLRAQMAGLGYRLALRRGRTRVIFQNPDDAALFERQGYIRVGAARVIRGAGVDIDRFRPRPESVPGEALVVLASRLLKNKGIFEFAEAARLLHGKGVEARFAIVGTVDAGNPDSLTEREVAALEAGGHVEMWGWREDMAAVLGQAHVACLPSYYPEGVPRFLIEAAASGLPAVTTNMPGCREAVADGENGTLVPPRDAGALATALEALLRDPERAATMGRAGRARAEALFADERVVAETLAVYRELLESPPSRADTLASRTSISRRN